MKAELTRADVVAMVRSLPLGAGHEAQQRAVAAALEALLLRGQRGVVLADEVGFGKTYEALAVMTLMREQAGRARREFRGLVLCKPSLVKKWTEEISTARAEEERGFPQHLRDPRWKDAFSFFHQARVIDRRYVADDLRASGVRGTRFKGQIAVPPGLYVLNEQVLGESARANRPLLKQMYRTRWDLIIVDEAHHYAKGNRPVQVFAPDDDLFNYDQGIGEGKYRHILALTATPFELSPEEMIRLLALVRAEPDKRDLIARALRVYVDRLDRFFDHRRRNPADQIRREDVAALDKLRRLDGTGTGATTGLESLLRRYIIRNTKAEIERRYFVVNQEGTPPVFTLDRFNKLDDLRALVARSPLIPFDGVDALFYLHLRGLIQETVDRARADAEAHQTFITTDLRQGLSSYRQIQASALLARPLDSAKRLLRVVDGWCRPRTKHLHPKVRAVVDLIREIAQTEVDKARLIPGQWLSKIVVFNKLIEGTATQLREEIEAALTPIFDEAVETTLAARGTGDREEVTALIRQEIDRGLAGLPERVVSKVVVPAAFSEPALQRFRNRPLAQLVTESLRARGRQPLFLLHAVSQADRLGAAGLRSWMQTAIFGPLSVTLERIAEECERAASATTAADEDSAYERAERDALALLDDYRSVRVVARYDGSETELRESHRRNFNLPYNPFVLLVSRVGEEGIDLQRQCRYIIHYDLEWNPARMEQREGRVDRVGWGGEGNGDAYIDIRFLLLKGTYEERMFHTVMQRDQWFQVLIGSKRRELGKAVTDESDADEAAERQETFVEEDERGRLTPEECRAVMLNLAPGPLD
jgi:hypothetical protein